MKGMQKIKRGGDFKGLINYLLDHTKAQGDGRIIGGTMYATDAKGLTKEFNKTRQLRPDVEKPVWHNSLRLPAGEPCSDYKFQEIAEDYLTRMGFDVTKTKYALIKHDDENAVHIAASRIMTDGTLYLGKNENLASTRHISALEKDHGLTITKGLQYDENNRIVGGIEGMRKDTSTQIQTRKRTAEPLYKDIIKSAIEAALAEGKCTAPEFARRVEALGVKVRASVGKEESRSFSGFSFDAYDNGNTPRKQNGKEGLFKGSQLGYSWKVLQEAGVTYDRNHDYRELLSYAKDPAAKKDADTVTEMKQKEWDKQAAALDADSYRIHASSPHQTMQPMELSADQVRSRMPVFEGFDEKGFKLTVEPISTRYKYIQINDVKPHHHQGMKQDGFTPCFTTQTSRASAEVVLKIPKTDDAEGAQVEADLQAQYGKPPKHANIPLAGTTRNGFTTIIVDATNAVCNKVKDLVAGLKARLRPAQTALEGLGIDGVTEADAKAVKDTFAAAPEGYTWSKGIDGDRQLVPARSFQDALARNAPRRHQPAVKSHQDALAETAQKPEKKKDRGGPDFSM